MRITKWGEYGILCCAYLAKMAKDKPAGSQEISEQFEIPAEYVQQIFQRLKKSGLIDTVRGPGGGYCLNKPANEISLKDILYAAEGKTFEVICDNNSIACGCNDGKHFCSLRKVWHDLRDSIDSVLSQKLLSDLTIETLGNKTSDVVGIGEFSKTQD